MAKKTSIDKRLKRQVVAKPAEFFAATAPGLEPLCLKELLALPLSVPAKSDTGGGVYFTGYLEDCYLANLCLRTANRVLMRVDRFKASNFRTLEKNLNEFPWELYLRQGIQPRLKVTTHRCRLHHSGAVAERTLSAISQRWRELAIEPPPTTGNSEEQMVYVRAVNDTFTVSLDSSGENLYRRGLKKDVTAAPLRETIAAAVLMLADYSPPEPLVDPMCGAGSFSLEAAMLVRNIPAGWQRDFAFASWPVFDLTRKRWEYIRKRRQQKIIDDDSAVIFASDVDPAACRALKANSDAAGLSQNIRVTVGDFFALTPDALNRRPGLLTLNPPFGRRLGSRKKSDRMFEKLFERLLAEWGGWKVGMVVPRQKLLKKVPFSATVLPIRHGGLRLYLVAGRVPI